VVVIGCEGSKTSSSFGPDTEAQSAVHVVNPDERRDHLQRLAAAGIDPTAAHKSGQFQLRTDTKTYLRDGRFVQDRILEVFEQLASGNAKDRRQRQ
jgi:MEDS: MEthanogen/methylotroph, DcmR Sensory domain